MKKVFWSQIIKYGIVGISNTIITAGTIWIMMFLVFRAEKEENVSPIIITVSNITGCIIGLINSFIWNRIWTFHSKNKWGKEFIKFSTAFLICYIPQIFLVNILNQYTNIQFNFEPVVISHAFTCQLIGLVFYTSLNFLLNKYYTFKPRK